jgi:hypothetical protein
MKERREIEKEGLERIRENGRNGSSPIRKYSSFSF